MSRFFYRDSFSDEQIEMWGRMAQLGEMDETVEYIFKSIHYITDAG
jgi:hypothetical protein